MPYYSEAVCTCAHVSLCLMSPCKGNSVLLLLNFLRFLVHELNDISCLTFIDQNKSCYSEIICVYTYICVFVCSVLFWKYIDI